MRGEPPAGGDPARGPHAPAAPASAATPPTPPTDDAPPFGGTWGRLYAVVLVTFGLVVGLLGWLTWAYR